MKIEHVFFDLDHTLWDFEKNSDLAFQKIFTEQNITIDIDSFLYVYKPLNREFWRLYREEKISKEDLKYQRLKTAFDKINFSVSDTLINKIAIDYIDYLPHFNHLFNYTFDILDYLKEKYETLNEMQKKAKQNDRYKDIIEKGMGYGMFRIWES